MKGITVIKRWELFFQIMVGIAVTAVVISTILLLITRGAGVYVFLSTIGAALLFWLISNLFTNLISAIEDLDKRKMDAVPAPEPSSSEPAQISEEKK